MVKKLIPLALFMCVVFTGCNKQLIDTSYKFNYAYVNIGNKVIEGKVESWTDFENGDQIQVKIDGITYLSSANNIVLVYNPNL